VAFSKAVKSALYPGVSELDSQTVSVTPLRFLLAELAGRPDPADPELADGAGLPHAASATASNADPAAAAAALLVNLLVDLTVPSPCFECLIPVLSV
jgi:hypothetical protein